MEQQGFNLEFSILKAIQILKILHIGLGPIYKVHIKCRMILQHKHHMHTIHRTICYVSKTHMVNWTQLQKNTKYNIYNALNWTTKF